MIKSQTVALMSYPSFYLFIKRRVWRFLLKNKLIWMKSDLATVYGGESVFSPANDGAVWLLNPSSCPGCKRVLAADVVHHDFSFESCCCCCQGQEGSWAEGGAHFECFVHALQQTNLQTLLLNKGTVPRLVFLSSVSSVMKPWSVAACSQHLVVSVIYSISLLHWFNVKNICLLVTLRAHTFLWRFLLILLHVIHLSEDTIR